MARVDDLRHLVDQSAVTAKTPQEWKDLATGAWAQTFDGSLAFGDVVVHTLETPRGQRRRGGARRVLERICAAADATATSLCIVPVPDDPDDLGWLVAFYESLEFAWSDEGYVMRREAPC